MLDLIFAILMIIILVKADKTGIVNDVLCNVALVIGVLAGILGLVQAFNAKGNYLWGLNILVMLIAFFLKRVAQHFAKLHQMKIDEIEMKYRLTLEHRTREEENGIYTETNFDDPNIRFGGGTGENWNGK